MIYKIDKLLAMALVLMLIPMSAFAKHYDVYLLGGQSNAVGRGAAAELRAPYSNVQNDVRFFWRKTNNSAQNGLLTQNRWISLQPGSGHGSSQPSAGRNRKEFGSEIRFGRTMANARPGNNIAIIKYAQGNTSLGKDWASDGNNYRNFLSTVRDALRQLSNQGHTYKLHGMWWIQGETDTGNNGYANNYENNLFNLISRIRKDLNNNRTFPFVISRLSNNQFANLNTPGTNAFKISRALQEVNRVVPQTRMIYTDGLGVYVTGGNKGIHFNANGQLEIGRRIAYKMLELRGTPSVANPPQRTGSNNNSNNNNLAFKKRASQSGNASGGVASRAVDGNRNGAFNGNSVSHTAVSRSPWWRVDLGSTRTIAQIKVYNRTDGCCAWRLNGARVYIGNKFTANPSDYRHVGTLNGNASQTKYVANRSGRYVMIRLPEQNSPRALNIAEVEIFGPGSGGRSVQDELTVTPIFGERANLEWIVQQEQDRAENVKQYIVQHSTTESDELVDVAIVPATDAHDFVTYDFIHDYPKAGRNIYHIAAEYEDGTLEYGMRKEISFDLKTPDTQMTIAPNPVQDILKIDLSKFMDKPIDFMINSIEGNTIMDGRFEANHDQVAELNLNQTRNGIYMIYLKPENIRATPIKFVVMKAY